jgi:[heparan sulfate]-glucosamine 3-sulfotransferase 5
MLGLRKPKELLLIGLVVSVSAFLLFKTCQHHREIYSMNKPEKGPEEQLTTTYDDDLKSELVRDRRLPQAIIIGTRKGGTRALAKFLEINPAIRSAHNEVHFFDRPENYKLGLEWYRNQMPLTNENQITIEKSPAYFVTNGVPERIKAMNASIKLIVIMRDPVTRLISDFSQIFANRFKYILDDYDHGYHDLSNVNIDSQKAEMIENKTTDWLEASRNLEEHVLREDGGIDEQRNIVRTGMYAMHLERWLSVFPRDQFHFVNGETLIKEPHVELQKLERFLGFSQSTIKKEHFVFSAKKGFFCLAKRNSVRDKRQASSRKLDEKDDFVSRASCLGRTKGRRHVPINKGLLEKLKSFYAPYNEYLYSLTGLNFTLNL